MNDCIYLTHTPNGSHYDITYNEALEYCKLNNGYIILSKTKNLFPKWEVVYEKTYLTGNNILITVKE